jgi:predicted RNA binding protein YcfA (HicA-like mRNA interferase family)
LVDGYYKIVVRELRRLGFEYDRNAKGSHERWVNAAGRLLIVPRSLTKRHTANGILKDAGSDLHL